MSMGLAMSAAETGVDEDAGGARITFRYRARIWRVVIEPERSRHGLPAPGFFDIAKELRRFDGQPAGCACACTL